MAQHNVDAVRMGIEAFNRRDFDAALELAREDVTWERFLSRVESGTREVRGKRELRAVWQSQVAAIDLHVDPHEFIPVGDDKVVVTMRLVGRGTGSGIPLMTSVAWVWIFDEAGAIRQVETFENADAALRAARAAD